MAIDLARASFDRARHYTGVAPQQGRVSLEAEENEAREIVAAASRAELREIVGPAGTPDDGYALTGLGGYDFTIGAGTMYVGGNRVSLDADIVYSDQPDWLDHEGDPEYVAPGPPELNEHVLLVLREYDVTAVEDAALREVALGGPDGAARMRIVQRVQRLGTGATTCPSALAEDVSRWAAEGLSFDAAAMELRSDGRLLVGFDPAAEPDDPCEPAAAGGYLGAENQVIRVQVTTVHEDGTFDLLWGWDNASFLYRVTTDASTPPVLTFDRQPVDGHHRPRAGQAVELLRGAASLFAADGEIEGVVAERAGLAGVLSAPYDPDTKSVPFPVAVPAGWDDGALFLRVWEELVTGCSLGAAVALAGTGLNVTLSGAARVGDFWEIGVRPETPSAVLPAVLLRAPQPPSGPRTWVAPLAVIGWQDREFRLLDDCRNAFEPLIEIRPEGGGCCTVSVRPSDAARLQAILDKLAAGRDPHDRTKRVTLCLKPGRYELERPLVLRRQHGHTHIEGCGEGAVLAAREGSEQAFTQGLIVLAHADNVRLTGLELELPLVPAIPGGVRPPTTGPAFANLLVSVGVRPVHSAQLEISRCLFRFRVGPREARPEDEQLGPRNVFAAGVFGGSECWGLRVADCRFLHDTGPGPGGEGPTRILIGLLLAPTVGSISARQGTLVRSLLDDAIVRGNRFAGLTLGAALFADFGDVRLEDNALTGGYGGFWLLSLETLAYLDTASRNAIGAVDHQTVLAVRENLTEGTGDPVLLTISVIARTYPLPKELSDEVRKPRAPKAQSAVKAAQKAYTRQFVTTAFSAFAQAEGKGHTFEVGEGRVTRAPLGLAKDTPTLREAHAKLSALEVSLAEPTDRDHLRLRCIGNDLDCELDGGAETSLALLAWAGLLAGQEGPAPTKATSALVAGNRMRGSSEGGIALVMSTGRIEVTGNEIENAHERGFSLAALPAAGSAPAAGHEVAAFTGNVLAGLPLLPARPFPAPLNTWFPFNAIQIV